MAGITLQSINLQRAIQLNSNYGRTLKWSDRIDQIVQVLGFTNITPNSELFVNAIARWQLKNFLTPDGVIGPRTWAKLEPCIRFRPTVANHKVAQSSGQNLTKNFSLSEFACKDGTSVPNNLFSNVKELATNLQVLRDSYNIPIRINSAYRTPTYNESIGGAANSQHLVAKAADIVINGVTPISIKSRIEKLIGEKKMKEGGIGVYNSFLHYDVRGTKARW